MPSLADIQRALVAHAYGETDGVIDWLRTLPCNARGLGVYAKSHRANLHDALSDVFPVVAALIGPECFRALARRHVELTPSRSASIHSFGSEFPAFIAATRELEMLGYLADVARLEWAWHESYHAADEPRFESASLARVEPEVRARLRFRLARHCRLLSCRYPALLIWQAHQSTAMADLSLAVEAGRYEYVVYRVDDLPRIVSSQEHRFLAVLADGGTLEEAFDASGAPASALARWVRAGVIAGLISDG